MRYAKMAAQVVATIVAAIIPLLMEGGYPDAQAWVNVAIVGVGACAVFVGPNVPYANVTKTVLSVLAAVLVLLNNVIPGGVSTAEWLQLLVAGLGALGVYVLPNAAAATQPPAAWEARAQQ